MHPSSSLQVSVIILVAAAIHFAFPVVAVGPSPEDENAERLIRPEITIHRSATGELTIRGRTAGDRGRYRLECSEDLQYWTPLGLAHLDDEGSSNIVSDPGDGFHRQRFYRAVRLETPGEPSSDTPSAPMADEPGSRTPSGESPAPIATKKGSTALKRPLASKNPSLPSLTDPSQALMLTKHYRVPARFETMMAREGVSAQELLEKRGIQWPGEASATYLEGTLSVQTTALNLELVDAFVESIQDGLIKQVEITIRLVEISDDQLEEILSHTDGTNSPEDLEFEGFLRPSTVIPRRPSTSDLVLTDIRQRPHPTKMWVPLTR